MLPSTAVLERLRTALAGREDVRLAVLFGSVARGTARTDSDVDIAIDAPDVDALRLADDLGAAVSREVDLASLADASFVLLEQLVRDGLCVHEHPRGAFADWRSRTLARLEIDRPMFRRIREAYLVEVAGHGPSRG